jgi:hypothetical protein
VNAVGRTIPSRGVILEQETVAMSRFKQFFGPEDRAVFDDLLSQCKLCPAEAGLLASPVKEVPLLLSMVFAQHKKLAELEKCRWCLSKPTILVWTIAFGMLNFLFGSVQVSVLAIQCVTIDIGTSMFYIFQN